jgi:hypothetical protein
MKGEGSLNKLSIFLSKDMRPSSSSVPSNASTRRCNNPMSFSDLIALTN